MKKNGADEEEEGKVTDMTGDMTDTEFEQIVYEVYERMKDCMYLTGKHRIRETLDKHRAELTSMGSMEIITKFEYDGAYFSQILGRIRRREEKKEGDSP